MKKEYKYYTCQKCGKKLQYAFIKNNNKYYCPDCAIKLELKREKVKESK